MTIKVYVPDLGNISAATIIEVLAKVGDRIDKEASLITLESDKASMDVPSSESGVLETLHVKVGDKVKTGDLIATLQSVKLEKSPPVENPAQRTDNAPQTTLITAPALTPEITSHQAENASFVKSTPAPQTALAHAGPAVRKMARLLGVNLDLVRGSGPQNRILKEDVEVFVKQTLENRGSSNVSEFSLPSLPQIDFSKFGEIEAKTLSRIKKLTAINLQRAHLLVPQVTQFEKADITHLETFRKSQLTLATEKGVKLTLLGFIMQAVVKTLKTYPEFNASLSPDGDQLILKKYFHIGIAVDTPEGLVVPVIRNVDQKGLFELAESLGVMSQKARNKSLSPADMQGGCFTISSLGGLGGAHFTPIVNSPEVAILGVSKAVMEPVYQEGRFVPKLMLPLSLSYDHRVIDGAAAAKFVTTLSALLADIRQLLL